MYTNNNNIYTTLIMSCSLCLLTNLYIVLKRKNEYPCILEEHFIYLLLFSLSTYLISIKSGLEKPNLPYNKLQQVLGQELSFCAATKQHLIDFSIIRKNVQQFIIPYPLGLTFLYGFINALSMCNPKFKSLK